MIVWKLIGKIIRTVLCCNCVPVYHRLDIYRWTPLLLGRLRDYTFSIQELCQVQPHQKVWHRTSRDWWVSPRNLLSCCACGIGSPLWDLYLKTQKNVGLQCVQLYIPLPMTSSVADAIRGKHGCQTHLMTPYKRNVKQNCGETTHRDGISRPSLRGWPMAVWQGCLSQQGCHWSWRGCT